MAPRARPKKNETRMAAALDAMRQFGFDDRLVKKVLKELLKTYDANWVFIEDNSYRVLLDLILEQQEQINEENTAPSSKTDAREGNSTPTTDAGPSSRNAEGVDAPELAPANASSLQGASAVPCAAGGEATPMQAESEGRVWKDIGLDESHHITDPPIPRRNKENSAAKPNGIPSGPPGFEARSYHVQHAAKPNNAVRKPCYGWISDGEDDEPEFMELVPAPLPESLEKLLMERENQRKRKSKWDVKPEDA